MASASSEAGKEVTWFLGEMINGIKSDRASYRTPEQMSENSNVYDYKPWILLGSFVALFFLLYFFKFKVFN